MSLRERALDGHNQDDDAELLKRLRNAERMIEDWAEQDERPTLTGFGINLLHGAVTKAIERLSRLSPTPETGLVEAQVERAALAMGEAITRTFVGHGRREPWADTERSGEGNILAEVDGEIDLEVLARAAFAALSNVLPDEV